MDVISVSQIEKNIGMLPRKDQLFLIERIIQRLRQKEKAEEENIEKQLTLMASDPNIQEELKKINGEFAVAEIDGLEPKGKISLAIILPMCV